MNQSFEYYLGVLRKHWLQILLIAVIVLVGGYLFYKRQVPVYQATVKLRIIRQQSRSPVDVSFTFEEDQVFYNTQYNLLRTQIDWAGMLLDRVAFRALDRLGPDAAQAAGGLTGDALVAKLGGAAAEDEFTELENGVPPELAASVKATREAVVEGLWGLDPDSFLDAVTATPIPGTHLAQLGYQTTDPGLAVFLVNMYAELYRDVAREERARSLGKEVKYRQVQRDALKDQLDNAVVEQTNARNRFTEKYPDLNPDGETNPFQKEADDIASALNARRTERLMREQEEKRLGRVLREQSILVNVDATGPSVIVTVTFSGDGGKLSRELATNLTILGEPVIESSEGVRLLRQRVRRFEEDHAGLLKRFTAESEEVRTAAARIDRVLEELAGEVRATIVRYFETGARLQSVIDELESQVEAKRAEAGDLNGRYDEVSEAREEVERLKLEFDSLNRDVSALERLQGDQSGGPLAVQNIRVERRARVVDTPRIRPNTMMIFLLTAAAAGFLAVGSAFLLELLDDTVKTKADFDRFVGVPDIGFIPRIGEKDFKSKDTAVLEKPRSAVAEAFRSIRTGILFSRRDEEIKTFLISSAGPGEGKTTVAVNLAVTMAQAGRGRVLLIDADLRKARVHKALGVENRSGLTNCLVGSAKLSEAVRETRVENLYVLSAGPTPPNPAELLGGHRMAEIIEEASREFGKVVIDTPPLVAVTDTCLLSPLVDGIFLVISMGKTSWRLIERGKQALAAVGVETTGAIVNDIRSSHRGYGYGYGYGYGRYYRYYGAEEE
jgi:capsular exopolysaccharide synthesis family protein